MDFFCDRSQKIKGQISRQLNKNKVMLDALLKDCNDIVKKSFRCGTEKNLEVYLLYTDGMVKNAMLEESIIKPLLLREIPVFHGTVKEEADFIYAYITEEIIEMADTKPVTAMEDAVTELLSGNALLFLQGSGKAVVISSKLFPLRGVQEADQEVAIRGSKDSFTESLRMNTALIRRRIRDSRLKVLQVRAGERSKTDVAILYMEDLVKPELLKKVKKRIAGVSMDGILDSGMLEQLMVPEWNTPFPCFQRTQRPDKTASGLLEGRIAIVTDNSPDALLIPVTFHTFFQASDDYYNQWMAAVFARLLRYGAALIALGLPAFYVAVANFHTEVLPTALIVSFAKARAGIPFPVVVEVLLMELAFELLREAGLRLPGQLGGTIGIVGGLIVGQAAVEAGLVSTIVVIVVALTAISSFSIPNESMTTAFRLGKFVFLFLSAFWGIYGFFLGWLFLIVHLSGLSCLGEPYLHTDIWLTGEGKEKYKDTYLRLPLHLMRKRPVFTRAGARIRRKEKKSGI